MGYIKDAPRQAVELIRLCLLVATLLFAFPVQSAVVDADGGHVSRDPLPISPLNDHRQSGGDPLEVELSNSDHSLFKTHDTRKTLAIGIFTVIFLAMLVLVPLLLLFKRSERKLDKLAHYAENIAYGAADDRAPFKRYGEPAERTFKALGSIDADRSLIARKLERAEQQADRLSEETTAANAKANVRLKLLQELTQELRTPLAGAAELLEQMQGQTSKIERDRDISQLKATVKTLSRQIDIASLQAHLDGDGLKVLRKPFQLSSLFQMISDEFDGRVMAKGISLLVENECQHELIGDRGQLFNILVNLADCLMRYSGREHTILKCEPLNEDIQSRINFRFTLKEAGESIGPERSYLLFNRTDDATRKDTDLRNAQITLTLCQRLARSLDGSLSFEASATGDWAIILELPFEIVTRPCS